tara:strand:+ start:3741 stop:4955 length:1215 start_codon:yes stop_codon:yes gene_type:complete
MKAWMLPLSAAVTLVSNAAYAVDRDGILMGSGVTVFPSVSVEVLDNDNVYLQPDATKSSSTITKLSPAVGVEADMGQTVLKAVLSAEKGSYSRDENDDYTDTSVVVGGDFELNSRHQLSAQASFRNEHDARGAGTVEGAEALGLRDPDLYDETVYDGSYTYGSANALFNITAGLNRYQKAYKNNFINGTRDREHNRTRASLDTAVYISPSTDFLVDLSATDIEYTNDSPIAESREGMLYRALVGASYELTGKLTSKVKVGFSERTFELSDVDSDDSFTWEGSLTWNPRTYSTITVFTSQAANETPSATSNYIDASFSRITWNHEFSAFFALRAQVSLAEDSYYDGDSGDVNREDEVVTFGLRGTYSPTTSVDMYAGIEQSDRSSTEDGLDYEQQVVSLGVTVGI